MIKKFLNVDNYNKYIQSILSNKNSIKYRFVNGVSWSFIGAIVSKFIVLLNGIITARILGNNYYGQLGIINNTISIFSNFSGVALGTTVMKHVAENRKTDPKLTGRIIFFCNLISVVLGALVSIASIISASYVASNLIFTPTLINSLRLSSLILLFNSIVGVQSGVLSGFEDFRAIAKINIISNIISFPITMLFLILWNINGAIGASIVTLLINYILFRIELKKKLKKENIEDINWGIEKMDFSFIWGFSLPAFLSGIVYPTVLWIANISLSKQLNGYGEIGIFNAANQWKSLLLFFPTLVGQIITPIMSERMNKDNNSVKKMIKISTLVSIISTFPIALVVSILSKWIMSQYGASFENGWSVLIIILITTCLISMQTPVEQIIIAKGKMWSGFFMNIGWAIVFNISFFSIHKKNALTLALSFFVAYFVHCIWVFWFVKTEISK